MQVRLKCIEKILNDPNLITYFTSNKEWFASTNKQGDVLTKILGEIRTVKNTRTPSLVYAYDDVDTGTLIPYWVVEEVV